MANEISVSGNKKIATLQKEFNKKFPFIRLSVYAMDQKGKSSKSPLPEDMTLAKARTKTVAGDISISGNKQIGNLESDFEKIFGIYVQVSYTDKEGNRYYTSGSDDKMTLTAFNAQCEKEGCKKDIYR